MAEERWTTGCKRPLLQECSIGTQRRTQAALDKEAGETCHRYAAHRTHSFRGLGTGPTQSSTVARTQRRRLRVSPMTGYNLPVGWESRNVVAAPPWLPRGPLGMQAISDAGHL